MRKPIILAIILVVVFAALLVSGCFGVSMYTTVENNGNISNMKLEINTTSYVYGLIAGNVQSQGYANMRDYFIRNVSKSYANTGNTVDYNEEWSGSNVKMTIDVRGSFKPNADSGISITKDGDYLRYEYTSTNQALSNSNTANSSFDNNMTQAMLGGVTFDYYVTMPGKIVDSNANVVNGNKAEWHFNGNTAGSYKTIYAKSQVAKTPGFEAVVALMALASGGYMFTLRRGKQGKN